MLKFKKFIGVLVAIFVLFTLTTSLHAGLDDKSLVLYLSFDEGKGGDAADGSVHVMMANLSKIPRGLMVSSARHWNLMEQRGSM